MHVIPVCPFISAYVHRHPEYHDLVTENNRQPGYWVGRDRRTRGSTAPAYVAGMDHFREGLKLAGLPGPPPSAAAAATASR